MTDAELDALVARLKRKTNSRHIEGLIDINPDGPDAAAALTTLRKQRDELRGALTVARNSVGDLRRGFAKSVEPTRWVEQLQEYIDQALSQGSERDTNHAD